MIGLATVTAGEESQIGTQRRQRNHQLHDSETVTWSDPET